MSNYKSYLTKTGDLVQAVYQFQEAMGFLDDGLPAGEVLGAKIEHLHEELEELRTAALCDDATEILDALADLVYIAIGAAISLNLPFRDAFAEVHRSNMEKEKAVRPEDSPRNRLPDAYKPDGWKQPDLDSIMEEHDYPSDWWVRNIRDLQDL